MRVVVLFLLLTSVFIINSHPYYTGTLNGINCLPCHSLDGWANVLEGPEVKK